MTEKETIQACLKGNRKAQFALYEQHKVYLYGVCMRYGKNREEAEDILQEGFYKILKDLKQFSGVGALRAWMRKVIVNTALMYIRKHHKVDYIHYEAEIIEHYLPNDVSLFEGERANFIIYLIRQLPVTQQLVFNLRAMDDYSFKEITKITGVKEATLRSHYLRARNQLQLMLKQELNSDG